MRAEVKVGLIVALAALVGGMIWYFQTDATETGEIGMEDSYQADPEASTRLLGDDAEDGFGFAEPGETNEESIPARPEVRRGAAGRDGPEARGNAASGDREGAGGREADDGPVIPDPFADPPTPTEPAPRPGVEEALAPDAEESVTIAPPPTRAAEGVRDPVEDEGDGGVVGEDAGAEEPLVPTIEPPPIVNVPPRRDEPRGPRTGGADDRTTRVTPPPTGAGGAPGTLRGYEIKRRHTIAAGDMLIRIAEAEYGEGLLWKAIVKANPELDPNRMKVGQEVVIPTLLAARRLMDAPEPTPRAEAPERSRETERSAAAPSRPAARRATYVVERGDSLISISRNVLGTAERWREIYELNRDQLANPNILRPGMELKLPPKNPVDRPDARG